MDCIVRVTGIMSMTSDGGGIQRACGQFEHAMDPVNLARSKEKKRKGGNTVSVQFRVVIKRDSPKCVRFVVATRECVGVQRQNGCFDVRDRGSFSTGES